MSCFWSWTFWKRLHFPTVISVGCSSAIGAWGRSLFFHFWRWQLEMNWPPKFDGYRWFQLILPIHVDLSRWRFRIKNIPQKGCLLNSPSVFFRKIDPGGLASILSMTKWLTPLKFNMEPEHGVWKMIFFSWVILRFMLNFTGVFWAISAELSTKTSSYFLDQQSWGFKIHLWSISRWWFQIFFIFTHTWGRFPLWLIFFKWVETTN